MKKLLLLLLIGLIPREISATSARNMIAMDMDSTRILYENKINDAHLIASISKIMTATIALELGNLESEVEATNTILKAFGSAIYIEVGEKMKLKDLLYGLMLRSGNDAALLIAEHVGGNVDNFVKLMNNKAQELGMKNTKFINPHGLENNQGEGNTSTAYDMALLTSYIMKNKEYQKIVSTKNYIAKSDRKSYSWANKNKLLNTYEYTTGGKTGFTERARRTLVSTASKDNKNIVIVTLNDSNDWQDHTDLYNKLFKEYERIKIIDANNFKINNENYYKKNKLYLQDDVFVLLKEREKKDISLDINLLKISNFKDGDVVGTVKIMFKNKILKEENIHVRKKEKKVKMKKNFWQLLKERFKK